MSFLLLTQNRVTKLMIMNTLKKLISVISLVFISCSNFTEPDPLHAVPIIRVKMGENTSIDLSNYFKQDISNVSIQSTGLDVELDGFSLFINGETNNTGLQKIQLLADGHPFTVLVTFETMIQHKFSLNSQTANHVVVMGGFNDWNRTTFPMEKNGDTFQKTLLMEPKRHEYKFVVDGKELKDPDNPDFVSNNIGGWNSILDLSDQLPQSPGQLIKNKQNGHWLYFDFIHGENGATPVDWVVLLNNTEMHPDVVDPMDDHGIKVNIQSIKEGVLRIIGQDSNGQMIEENRTIIKNGRPLNTDSDSWYFSIIYNTMVDRFFDGNSKNNKPIFDPKLPDLANFNGGDLSGIHHKIDQNYFSDLGVTALWISPIQTQPDSSWIEWILPNRTFSGYHGYWPIKAREIDPRFGTNDNFHQLIQSSHEKDIKVILDFVSNHVHQDHDYYQQNPDWFGQVDLPDGRTNIRLWGGDTRLTTWFDEFIPSYDFPSSPEALNQVVDDAVWWAKTYNLDGFRQDAVKHVPHAFWKSLTKKIRTEIQHKKLYQIGETFGSDELIGSYVNPAELDAQFNFSIYFNSRHLFSQNNPDFSQLETAIEMNKKSYGPIHLMGNITSSHDQFRFAGYADGQMSFSDDGVGRSFENPVEPIKHTSTFSKLANYYAFNVSQPGIPIIYYGEEIALMGEGDPGNRRMMRFDISQDERNLKTTFSLLNKLRQTYPSLSLGDQMILKSDGPIFLTLKSYFSEHILLAINNSDNVQKIDIEVPIDTNRLIEVNGDLDIDVMQNSVQLTMDPFSFKFFHVK